MSNETLLTTDKKEVLALNNVYLGDCIEVMNQIEDKSIDLILCDLPYGITACKWDIVIPLESLWIQYKRIIKESGCIVLTATMPFGANLIMSNPKWFRHEWIWQKNNGSNPFNVKRMPFQVHEHILVFSKKATLYNPQMLQGCKSYYMKARECNFKHLGNTPRTETINNGNRYPISVQKFSRDYGKSIHQTQKPVALFEYIIKTYTNEGMLVLARSELGCNSHSL